MNLSTCYPVAQDAAPVVPMPSDTRQPLQTALDSQRPIPAGEVEELVADLRRLERENSNNPRL